MDPLLEKKLISSKEASEFSGYHSDYLARMARSGKIDGMQVGRTWLVSKVSVENFMRDQEERKRELSESLARSREEEYRKRNPEVVPEAVAQTIIDTTPEEKPAETTPVEPVVVEEPILSPLRAPIISPYAQKPVNQAKRHAFAIGATLAIVLGSSALASTGVITAVGAGVLSFAEAANERIAHSFVIDADARFAVSETDASAGVRAAELASGIEDVIDSGSNIEIDVATAEAAADFDGPGIAYVHSTGDERMASAAALAALQDPKAAATDTYTAIATVAVEAEPALDRAYQSALSYMGAHALALATGVRDAVAYAPYDLARAELAFGTMWMDASRALPGLAVESVRSLGDTVSVNLAQGINRAPDAYDGAVYAWVDGAHTVSGTVARSSANAGTDVRLLASALQNNALGVAGSLALAVERTEVRPVASPLAALTLPSFHIGLPAWFTGAGERLARLTYGVFGGMLDWGGYAVATLGDPFATRFPVITMLVPGQSGSVSYGDTYIGTTTSITNVTTYQRVDGASIDYVNQRIAALQRSVEKRRENDRNDDDGSSNGGSFQNGIIDGATITNSTFTGGSFTTGSSTVNGLLTVNGDTTITGTLTVGNLNYGSFSLSGPIAAPYFTATSSTATSTFAGGFAAARVEGGEYIAGPYVLATSTSATSVFSGNIAVGRNATFGTSAADTLTINSSIGSSLIPSTTSTYDLGSSTRTWRSAFIDAITATSVTAVNATSTYLGTTNFTLGSGTFTSLLGTGLTNIGGSLSVATSTLGLDASFFKQGGNLFGTSTILGSLDNNPLTFITNGLSRVIVDTAGRVGIATSSPGSLFSVGGIANFTTGTSTFYGTGGIDLTSGCFSINGTCIGNGVGGAVSSVFGRTGAVVAQSGDYTTDQVTEGTNQYYTNGRVQTYLDTIDKGYFFSTTSATYFLAQAGVGGFSTTSANYWLSTRSTTNLAEGTNLYYTDARARAAISSAAPGLTYTSGTGVFSITPGYAIPLTASTSEWDSAYQNRITSATAPLQIVGNAISVASGYSIPLTASSTAWNNFYDTPSTRITAGTNLSWAGNTLNGLSDAGIRSLFSAGSGLSYNSGTGAFSLDATGNWTGTFDGQEGSYYLANSFSTTSADYWQTQRNFFSTTSAAYFLAQNGGAAFSTTSANAWLATKSTTNLAEGTNLYYTDARVNSFIAASTTIVKTFASNVFTGAQTFNGGLTLGTLNGPLQANNGVVSATTSIGVLYGGTGLTSAPTYGQLLVGNSSGGYTLTSTSSLGIVGGVASVFGRTGAVVALSGDYTTTLVTEGTNLYYTDARVNSFVAGSSTIAKTYLANTWGPLQTFSNGINVNGETFTDLTGTGLSNSGGALTLNTAGNWTGTFDGQEGAYYLANSFSTTSASYFLAQNQGAAFSTTSANVWLATKSTTDLAEGSNLYYTLNRFASALAGTTTDALAQGSTNLYYSNTLVNSFVAASTTIAKTYANNVFGGTQTFNNFLATNGTTTNASSTNLYVASAFRGAGLTACSDADDKLLYDAATGQFVCSSDAGAGGGLTSLNGLIASTQTFATSSDTNIGLSIVSSGSTHTFTPTWTGSLAVSRGGTGSTTLTGLLKGNGTGAIQSAIAGVDYIATTAGDWTGTFDGQEGSYYLANSFSTTSANYNLSTFDKGYFYSTTSANAWLATKTTSDLAEGSNLYYTLNRFASALAGTTTDALAQGSTNLYYSNALVNSYVAASSTIAKTYTANSFSALQTFANGINVNGETFTDLTGTGLSNVGGALTLNATGDWTGTFDGQEGSYYLANSFSTTSANYNLSTYDKGYFFSTTSASYFLAQNGGAAFSTTSANAWLATKSTTNLAEGTNLYYTDARVNAYVAASTTIAKTYSANIFSAQQTFNSGFLAIGSSTINGNATTTGMFGVGSLFINSERLTDLTGTGLSNVGGALTLNATGDWTGTFDGQEGSYYLANSFSTTSANYNLSTFDKGYFYSTTSANAWLATKSTTNLTEGSNLYYTDARVNSFIAGSTTIAKTFAANTWSQLQTFSSGVNVNGETITDLTGTGLSNVGGALTLNATGDWTGTFDGQEGSYYLANSFSTTSASYFLSQNGGGAYSTTSANYWLTTKTTSNLAEGSNLYYTDARVGAYISGSSTIPHIAGTAFGDMLYWTGSGWGVRATSTLGVALSDTTGILAQNRGGTGIDIYTAGDILYVDGGGNLAKLPIGAAGTVLKVQSGLPAWGVDQTLGVGGGDGVWATSTNIIYPQDTSNVVVVGAGATSSPNSIFEVSGQSYFSNRVGIGSTSPAALLSVGGNAYVTGGFGVGVLNTSAGTLRTSGLATFGSGINVNGETVTDLTGTGIINSGGALTLDTSGDWTGTFDGQEGSYYLANSFSTTSASYFLAQNQGAAFSTTSANVWLSTKTTSDLAEGSNLYYTLNRFASALAGTTTDALAQGSTNLYYSNTLVNSYIAASTTIAKTYATNTFTAAQTFTGGVTIGSLNGPLQANNGVVSATSSIGVLYGGTGLTSAPTYGQVLLGNGSGGYTLTSTSSLGLAQSFTASYPIVYSGNNLSLAFGTTTANTWSQLQTFSSGINVNAETFTDLTGTGLQNSGGVLTLNATGDWTGTFDGQEGSYYLANSFSTTSADYWQTQRNFFSTTSASYFLAQNQGAAYSTTSANAWLATKSTTNLAEGTNLYFTNARADARINATSTIGTLTSAPNLGTVSTGLTGILRATAGVLSTGAINLASGDVTGILPVTNGGTGWGTLASNTVLLGNGTGAVATTTRGTITGTGITVTGGTNAILGSGVSLALDTTGDWTGTFDGQEGSYYLANSFSTTSANYNLSTYDKGYFFSTTSAAYFLSQNGGAAFSTTSANAWLATKSTTNLAEGTNLYYTDARVNTYVAASTTIAKTYTANTFSALQTFSSGVNVNGETITDFTGTGLSNVGGALTLNATGDWTGTFDGQEGSYYLANSFSTTSANYNLSTFDKGYFYSTTSANAWLATKTTSDLAEGSNLYYTLNRFATALAGTTTDALAQGSTNLYYSNALVNSYVAASTTIAKTYTANTFSALQTFTAGLTTNALTLGSLNGPLQANNGVVSATSSIGVLYGGTGLSSAPSYGQVLLGNGSGGYTLTSTSSLGLLSTAVTSIGPTGQQQSGPSIVIASSSSTTNGLTSGITVTGAGNTLTFAPTLSGTLGVAGGGTGSTTLSGLLKGNGTGAIQTAVPGTDYVANTTGDWTGTFDGQEGAYYLANSFSTTSANAWLATKSTTNLAEGSNLYYTDARVNTFVAASTTIAKTYAANTFSAQQTFNSGFLAVGSSTINGNATTTGMQGVGSLFINSERFTDLTGTGLTNTAGVLTLDATGNWTGTFDGQEGAYYLANSFSTTSASYFLAQNQGAAFSTTSANVWLTTKSTTDLAEGSNLYYTLNRFATALAGTTTDALAQGSTNLYYSNALVNSYVAASSTIAKTYTANTFSALQTFANGVNVNGETFTDLTGTGLSNVGGALTLNATGDWTGTFDGQEGAYYLANSFSTTSANYWQTTRNFFSTTSADYWETQQVARTADDLTNNSIEDLSDVAAMTENYGDLLYWNGSAWADIATSSLGLPTFSSLGSYLALTDWYATTTDGLDEGVANLYFTNARADARINATSTIGTLTSAPNLGTVSTGLTGILRATAGVLSTGAINLASGDVTGILPVTNGGTGWGTIASNTVLLGNGTGALSTTTRGTITGTGITVGGGTNAILGSGVTLTLDATGNWTGTFDGQEGSYYLANSFSTTSADYWQTQRNFFSTTSASYFLSQNQGAAYSTTSANYWLTTKTTANLAESGNLYYTDARVNTYVAASTTIAKTYTANTFNALQTFTAGLTTNAVTLGTLNGPLQANAGVVSATSSIGVLYGGTGLTTAPTYGQILLGNGSGGYTLTATSSLGLQGSLAFTYPLVNSGGTVSLAFGTTTANTWSQLQTFSSGINVNSETITDFTGTGLSNSGGALTLNATGDWTGTFDGQEGSYYLANSFSTTSASYFLTQNTGAAFSTTSAQYFVHSSTTIPKTYTANTFTGAQVFSGGVTIGTLNGPLQANAGVVSATTSIGAIYGGTGQTAVTTGDLLYGSGTNTWSRLAGVATGNALISGGVGTAPSWGKIGLTTHVTGVLPVDNGGTGTGSLTAGVVIGNGTSPLTSVSSSVGIANVLSDETGTGGLVFASSPTFNIQITTPLVTNAGTLALSASPGNIITFTTNAVEQVRLTAAGNFGIGTSSPYAKLSVAGEVVGQNFTATSTTASSTMPRLTVGTALNAFGDYITDFTGTGLTVSGGALTVNATGDWTGTFDGQEGSYYLANSFSTTSANYWLTQNIGSAFSTTSANAWLATKSTTNLAEGSNLYYTDTRVGDYLLASSTFKGAVNYWQLFGSDLAYEAGNVGIGNSSPFVSIGYTTLSLGNASNGGMLTFQQNGSERAFIYNSNGSNVLNLQAATGVNITSNGTVSRLYVDSSTGNVGIGTTSPYAKLSVAGRVVADYFTGTTTATSTFGGGLDIASGCYAVGGICLSSGATYTGTYPVQVSGSIISLAFGTTTANTWSQLQTFSSGVNVNGETVTDFTGTGLSNSGGALTLNATGDWTGTFDGQEGSYYLANSFSTTSAQYFVHSSTTIAKTYTANTFTGAQVFSGGVTIGTLNGPLQANNGVVSATTSVGVLYGGTGLTSAPTYGQILLGNGSGGYSLAATSTLGLSPALTFSYPLVNTANTVSLAFGTTTANAWSSLQTFTGGASVGGTLSITGGRVDYTTAATTTVVNNNPYAWTIATSSTGSPLFRVDTTTGSESVSLGGGSGNVIIGNVGQVTALVFEEDTVIRGQTGGRDLTFGATGDTINFGVNVGIGTSSPYAKLSVVGQAVAEFFTATSTTATSTFPRLALTALSLAGDYITDFTGTGLTVSGGALTVNATGDWTGTFDGQEGAYYLANSFSTTSAQYFTHSSTTIPKTYTANTFTGAQVFSGGVTIGTLNGPLQAVSGVVSATSTLSVAYGGTGVSTAPTYGQILVGNSSGGYTLTATSSLGLGTGSVGSGTTGQFPYYAADGTTLTATSSLFLATTGRIGIATTTPSARLGIQGLSLSNTTRGLSVSNSSGVENFAVLDGGYAYVRTRFGIGTSTPAYAFQAHNASGQSDIAVTTDVNVGSANTTSLTFVSDYDNTFAAASIGQFNTADLRFSASGNLITPHMTLATGGNLGIGTTSPYAKLSVVGQIVGAYFTGTTTATSSLGGGLEALALNITGSATSTFNNGINLATGCFSVGGVCVGGSSGSGTVGSGTTGQFPYYAANGTTLTATSTLFLATTGRVGIGSTTPAAKLGVTGDIYASGNVTLLEGITFATTSGTTLRYEYNAGLGAPAFVFTSGGGESAIISELVSGFNGNLFAGANFSAAGNVSASGGGAANDPSIGFGTASPGLFNPSASVLAFANGTIETMRISSTGNVGIGTTSPYAKLSVAGQIVGSHFTGTTTATSTLAGGLQALALNITGTATSTFNNGINLATGCFSVGGVCVGGSSGSGTVGSGTTGQFPYYAANGTTLTATSTLFLATNERVGIGSTTPAGKLGVAGDVYASGFFNTSGVTGGYKIDNNLVLQASSTKYSIAVGIGAAQDNSFGVSGDSAFGHRALNGGALGGYNTAIGYAVLDNLSGGENTAVGAMALGSSTGSNNLAFGVSALRGSSGNSNIGIGYQVANNSVSGSNNIIIGYDIDLPSTSLSNQLNIGNLLYGRGIDGSGTTLSSGNIGIGTTSPYAKLSVTNIGTAPSFLVEDSASPDATPFIIDASGNVGIGTTTPGSLLSINGIANFTAATTTMYGTGGINLTNGGCFAIAGVCVGTGGATIDGVGASNRLTFWSDTDTLTSSANLTFDGTTLGLPSFLSFGTAATTTIVNNSPYAFTIATSTTGSPLFRVSTVVGAENVTVGSGLGDVVIGEAGRVTDLVFQENTTIRGAVSGRTLTFGSTTDKINFAVNTGFGSTTPWGQVAINPTTANGAAPSFVIGSSTGTHFIVTNAGRIGIGSTSPSSMLAVVGTSTLSTVLPAGPYTSNVSAFSLGASGQRWNQVWTETLNVGTSTWSLKSGSSGRLGFYSQASGAGTETLSLLANGNVGIGTTSPYTKLAVAGTGRFDGLTVAGDILPESASTFGAANTVVIDDESGSVSNGHSQAIAASGFPIVSYYDESGTPSGLTIDVCGNAACTSGNSTVTIPAPGFNTNTVDMEVGTDGFPLLGYQFSPSSATAVILHCGNATCTSGNATTSVAVSNNLNYTALEIDGAGRGVFSYDDSSTATINLFRCANTACSSGSVTTPIDLAGTPNMLHDMTIGSDGFPVIAYLDQNTGTLQLLDCGNATCSSGNSTQQITSSVDTSPEPSVELGADGFPVIVYRNNNLAYVADCANATCSSGTTITNISGSVEVTNFSLELQANGNPAIAFNDQNSNDITVVFCSAATCAGGGPATPITSNGDSRFELRSASSGMVLSYANTGGTDVLVASGISVSGPSLGNALNYFVSLYVGQVLAKNITVSAFDLAENYPSKQILLPGDIVALDEENPVYVKKAYPGDRVIGIVSTEPGITLANWNDEKGYPVALAGRVPVKVGMENGAIVPGDRIALSTSTSTPGVGRKALPGEPSVGIALTGSATAGTVTVFVNLTEGSVLANVTETLVGAFVGMGSEDSASSTPVMLALRDGIFTALAERFAGFGVWFTEGATRIAQLATDSLTVGSNALPTGITLYDVSTGEPFCVSVMNGTSVTLPGACPEAGFAEPSSGTPTFAFTGNGTFTGGVTVGSVTASTSVSAAFLSATDAMASSTFAGSLTVGKDIVASRFVAPFAANGFLFGSTTLSEDASAAVLTEDGLGLDVVRLATFTLEKAEGLALRMNSLELQVDDIANRLATLEAAINATSTEGFLPNGAFSGMLASAMSGFGASFENGIAFFEKLKFSNLFVAKGEDGGSAVGTGEILEGNTVVEIKNPLVATSSKVFITMTSPVEGQWYLSDKGEGKFRVKLTEVQENEVTFDYFIVQTEGDDETEQDEQESPDEPVEEPTTPTPPPTEPPAGEPTPPTEPVVPPTEPVEPPTTPTPPVEPPPTPEPPPEPEPEPAPEPEPEPAPAPPPGSPPSAPAP